MTTQLTYQATADDVRVTFRAGPVRERKPRPGPGYFRRDIQGLRAIAVAAVVADHLGLTPFAGGYTGVDVFFVISGYLMTSHLWRRVRDDDVDLLDFFGRRAKRLLPAASFVLVATAGLTLALLPRGQWADIGSSIVASALYSENWYLVHQATDYLNAAGPPSPLQHYWSLAVEEQFYLVWPALFVAAVAIRHRRLRRRFLLLAIVTSGLASFAWCLFETATAADNAYFSTFSRIWEFAVGGLVALAPAAWRSALPRTIRCGLTWAGLGGIVASIMLFDHTTVFPGHAAGLPALSTAAIILFCDTSRGTAGIILDRRPLQFLGKVSYSLYLWHWPVIIVATHRLDRLTSTWIIALVVACVMLAALTERLVETPLRDLAVVSFSPWRPLQIGVIASVSAVLVGLVLSCVAPLALEPRSTSEVAAAARYFSDSEEEDGATIETPRFGAGVLGDAPRNSPSGDPKPTAELLQSVQESQGFMGCVTKLFDPGLAKCSYGHEGSSTTVALLGDSHAQQWLPALEQIAIARNWNLHVFIKQYCLVMDGQLSQTGRRQHKTCLDWNADVKRQLDTLRPQLVIISNYIQQADPVAEIAKAQASRLAQLTGTGSSVVVIRDTPKPPSDMHQCLIENEEDHTKCAFPRATAIRRVGDAQERAVKATPGARLVDVNDAICPRELCAPVIGGVVVYRDSNHLTNMYALSLMDRLDGRWFDVT
jgi:peptidoglycan/LPS O-acetylase OafA/YrhL